MDKGMSYEVGKKYIAMRAKVDESIKVIAAFTSLLSHYKESSGDAINVDLYSLGYVHEVLHSTVWDIMEELERFMPVEDIDAWTEEKTGT